MRLFLAAAGLLTPVVMMAAHPLLLAAGRHGPNAWFGYRTPRSRRTEHGWRCAQELCARVWLRVGAVAVVVGVGTFVGLAVAGAPRPLWEAASVAFALGPLLASSAWCVVVVERRLAAVERQQTG
ncbi:SdpI family protein [Cellulomonas sp. Y8]|uniref:SdpI family protein n=1 Tax=Cellulomonas sp. Y8 TaxID=2591145 RepID=UPI0011C8604B|nr:SdpI family protein [Cellulomonas sp. Y8]